MEIIQRISQPRKNLALESNIRRPLITLLTDATATFLSTKAHHFQTKDSGCAQIFSVNMNIHSLFSFVKIDFYFEMLHSLFSLDMKRYLIDEATFKKFVAKVKSSADGEHVSAIVKHSSDAE